MLKKSSRIYIAGHSGLIGSAVQRALERHRFPNLLTVPHSELDLCDSIAVQRFFKDVRPEYVVLAAGRVGGIVDNQSYPADFMSANLGIQLNVLGAAHHFGVKKTIFFGSSCMYPRDCRQPMAESALLSGYPEPTSLAYAISKLAGMQMCLAYNHQFDDKRFMPVIPNSAYGPNDNFEPESGHVLSALISRFHEAKVKGAASLSLWGSGYSRREFVHVDDIAEACVMLLTRNTSQLNFPLNLGTGKDVSIRELALSISSVVGYKGELNWDTSRPDGSPRKLLDSSRLRAFGWRPKVELINGLKSTYEWYLENKQRKDV